MQSFVSDEALYYIFLSVLILFCGASAFLLSPLFIVDQGFVSFIVTVLLGLIYGFFSVLFVQDLELLTHHHYVGVLATMVVGSVVSFITVFLGVFNLIGETALSVALAFSFSASFFIPYIVTYVGRR